MDYRRARELLSDRGSMGPLHPAAAWRLRMSRVGESEPAALDFLRLMAFLAPELIPLELLLTAKPHQLGPRLEPVVGDATALSKLIGVLRSYSLVSSENDGIQIQERLQVHIRHDLTREQTALWAERAARLVHDAFPAEPYDSRQWEWIARLKPHAVRAARYAEQVHADYAWRLLTAVGIYLGSRGCSIEDLREALGYLSQAQKLAEGRYGPDAREVAFILKALGRVSWKLHDTDLARDSLERALRIEQAPADLRGPDYRTAAAFNNYGLLLLYQGEQHIAWEMITKALAICEAVYGAGSRESAWPLHSLAMVLRESQDLSGAREVLEQVLAIEQAAYGPAHIEVAQTLFDLAGVLLHQGDRQGASEALENALRIFEATYGNPEHPQTTATLIHLAAINLRMGRLRAAWHNVRRIRFPEEIRRAA
jgi:tetratricopeptide (TPR) repeat protein